MIKEKLKEIIEDAINKAAGEGKLGSVQDCSVPIVIEKPRLPEHGDLASGAALKLASQARNAPIKIAETIASYIEKNPAASPEYISRFNAVPPGYVNFHIGIGWLKETLRRINQQGADYGRSNLGQGQRVLLEYVSANPTGDLHIGHGRNAVYGNSLANLLKFAGFNIEQEFYVNDTGEQIFQLSQCAWSLYQKKLGRDVPYPENGYPQELLSDYLDAIVEKHKDEFLKLPAEDGLRRIGEVTKQTILQEQKKLLERIGIKFDRWFSEESLHTNDGVNQVLAIFKENGFSYEADGALWLKSKELGDERDRVLRRSAGTTTYLAADAAYHLDKYDRGYDRLITIWGADHHGQVPGLKAAVKALGKDPDKMEMILTQIVNLWRDGQLVRMSKRKGTVVTLAEVADEVGVDAVRYYLAESNPQNPIAFDLELAKKTSRENPAFYIQYAHARCCAILRKALEPSVNVETQQSEQPTISAKQWQKYLEEYKQSPDVYSAAFDSDPVTFADQKALVMCLESFPEELEEAAINRIPGRLARYAYEVANYLQKFYEVSRVITDDPAVTKARLGLILATKQVLANALGIIGVSAPERM
jgi:arginyl-tRNA synthetase